MPLQPMVHDHRSSAVECRVLAPHRVLACQLNDPCWEGMAARGLGMLNTSRGDHAAATTWLEEAAARSNRVSDRYQCVRAHVWTR